MLEFKSWLLMVENQTVSQFLKQNPESRQVKSVVVGFLSSRNLQIPPTAQPILVNWLSKELIVSRTAVPAMQPFLQNMWNQVGHYVTGNISNPQFASKLNSMESSYEKLVHDSEEWLHKNGEGDRKPGAVGTPIIELGGLGGNWKGWKWVKLNGSQCRAEADSMGHCGNSHGKPGDEILSLRDPDNVPRLTFIVNRGALGESKARGNSKPPQRYHPAIVELLKSRYVTVIMGGGYMQGKNFKLEDLSPEMQAEVMTVKPNIDNMTETERAEKRRFAKIQQTENSISYTIEEGKKKLKLFSNVIRHNPDNNGTQLIYSSFDFGMRSYNFGDKKDQIKEKIVEILGFPKNRYRTEVLVGADISVTCKDHINISDEHVVKSVEDFMDFLVEVEDKLLEAHQELEQWLSSIGVKPDETTYEPMEEPW